MLSRNFPKARRTFILQLMDGENMFAWVIYVALTAGACAAIYYTTKKDPCEKNPEGYGCENYKQESFYTGGSDE